MPIPSHRLCQLHTAAPSVHHKFSSTIWQGIITAEEAVNFLVFPPNFLHQVIHLSSSFSPFQLSLLKQVIHLSTSERDAH